MDYNEILNYVERECNNEDTNILRRKRNLHRANQNLPHPPTNPSRIAGHESHDNPTDPPAAETWQPPSPNSQASDLPGATISPGNRRLDTVYGDYIDDNPCEHLDGGIEDDGFSQDSMRRLVTFPNSQCNVPKRAVDKD